MPNSSPGFFSWAARALLSEAVYAPPPDALGSDVHTPSPDYGGGGGHGEAPSICLNSSVSYTNRVNNPGAGGAEAPIGRVGVRSLHPAGVPGGSQAGGQPAVPSNLTAMRTGCPPSCLCRPLAHPHDTAMHAWKAQIWPHVPDGARRLGPAVASPAVTSNARMHAYAPPALNLPSFSPPMHACMRRCVQLLPCAGWGTRRGVLCGMRHPRHVREGQCAGEEGREGRGA